MEEYGTDALRFTVLVGSTPGNDMNLSIKKVEANRNFANKIWNAGRFVIGALERVPDQPDSDPQWTLANSWIWARSQQLINDVERLFSNHQYGEAGRQIYDFFWTEYADWYLEIAKLQINEGGDRAFYSAQTTVRMLDTCLRLLHPFTPFVTEELWGHLKNACIEKSEFFSPKNGWEESLMIAAWPQPQNPKVGKKKNSGIFLDSGIIRAIRNVRTENKIQPGKKVPAIIIAGDKLGSISNQKDAICSLANLDPEQLSLVTVLELKPADQISMVISGVEIFLSINEMVDCEAEKERLNKEFAEVNTQIDRLNKLLNSPFANKAPANVVENERNKLETYIETASKLQEQLQK